MNARVDMKINQAELAIAVEKNFAAPNYAPIPVVVDRGEGSWLWDADGKRYLDFMSAYSAVSHGHAHPRLVAALTDQAQRVAVTSRAYHSTELGPFLAKLVEVADLGKPAKALPASGGAESVETAIKAARRWGYRVKGVASDHANIVVARGNFHGRSTTIVGFSTEPAYRADFGPFAPGFRHFDFGDIESLRAAIDHHTCAILIEPIQGEAGIVLPPEGFLRAVRELADERNVLLILDEIQSGLGRTGQWFAYMHEGIRPDGVIVGKALGGGLLPVSAFVAINSVMDLLEPGSHGSTFGGNPLAARVGREALAVIEEEQLVERSRDLGEHLLSRLRALTSPLIRAVRGRGLWVGVELDASVSARKVAERMAASRRSDQGHARNSDSIRATTEHQPRGARLGYRRVRGCFVRVRPRVEASGQRSRIARHSDGNADCAPDDECARALRGQLHNQPLDAAVAVVGVFQEVSGRRKARLEPAETNLRTSWR